MSDVVPLFATLATGLRPFADVLPIQPTTPGSSPWSPKLELVATNDDKLREAELDKARREAMDQGRADGLRETEEMRAKLQTLIGELEQHRAARIETFAEAIADAAVTAIEAWVGASDRRTQFQPIVRGWLAAAGDKVAATARVNPADVAAMQAAIGETAIRVDADPTIAPGDVKIRGEALDTTHVWRDRLRELRDTIATAIEQAPP
jgi:flagellar biosynthesis/type III secretory pathway protein FliH